MSQEIKSLKNLISRLEKIEEEIKICPTHYTRDVQLVRELVTKTLGISIEITSYVKVRVKSPSTVVEIASLLKRQSALLRAVCKVQRQSVQMERSRVT